MRDDAETSCSAGSTSRSSSWASATCTGPGAPLTEADNVLFSDADDEPAGAAPRRRVVGRAAVRAAARELDVDAGDARRRLGRPADAGHDRREPRLHRRRASRTRCSTATRSTARPDRRRSGSRRRGPGRASSRSTHTGRNQDDVVVATATPCRVLMLVPRPRQARMTHVRRWARRCSSAPPTGPTATRRPPSGPTP